MKKHLQSGGGGAIIIETKQKGIKMGKKVLNEVEKVVLDFESDPRKLYAITTKPKTVKSYGIYDAVRGSWRIAKKRADLTEYVLAIEGGTGRIVAVFKPISWHVASSENKKKYNVNNGSIDRDELNRLFFVGEAASEEIQALYLDKFFDKKKGVANPAVSNFLHQKKSSKK